MARDQGDVRIARIRRTVPEGKGADFYANICETLRHDGTTHTRGMSTRRRRRHRREFRFSLLLASRRRRFEDECACEFLAVHIFRRNSGAMARRAACEFRVVDE